MFVVCNRWTFYVTRRSSCLVRHQGRIPLSPSNILGQKKCYKPHRLFIVIKWSQLLWNLHVYSMLTQIICGLQLSEMSICDTALHTRTHARTRACVRACVCVCACVCVDVPLHDIPLQQNLILQTFRFVKGICKCKFWLRSLRWPVFRAKMRWPDQAESSVIVTVYHKMSPDLTCEPSQYKITVFPVCGFPL